jgi:long-chain fatty acid transport protein
MKKYPFAVLAACALVPQVANASGYGLFEHSADAMGTAYAGSAATGTDASYMVYNPAALGYTDGFDFSASLAGIFPDVSSHYTGTTSAIPPLLPATPLGSDAPKNFVSDAAVPALATRWRVADRWALGVSVSAPWGLMTTYPKDWVGRYYGIDTKLMTINITPLISYQIAPHVVIAAGPQAQYANGTFTNAIDVGTIAVLSGGTPGQNDIDAKFKANGWGWGWTAGIMAQLTDNFTGGVSYRSSIDTTAKGNLSFQGVSTNPFAQGIGIFTTQPAQTSLTTPGQLNIGARWRICPDWSLLGEADWTEWSVFKHLQISPANPALTDFTATNWKDSWFFALGAEYQASDRWTLKAGTAFDESPIPNSTKGPRIPDNNRTWLSVGTRYHASDAVDISFSAAHLLFANSHVNLSQTDPGSTLRGNLTGSISGSVNVVAVQLSFHTQ